MVHNGPKNSGWRGDAAKYQAMHMRVVRSRGRASSCSRCGMTEPDKTYDWANLTGHYADIQDYEAMCRSCHRLYDHGREDRVVGVQERRGRYRACITIRGEQRYLGTFDTEAEAASVVQAAREQALVVKVRG